MDSYRYHICTSFGEVCCYTPKVSGVHNTTLPLSCTATSASRESNGFWPCWMGSLPRFGLDPSLVVLRGALFDQPDQSLSGQGGRTPPCETEGWKTLCL